MEEIFGNLLHYFKLPLTNPVLLFTVLLLLVLFSPILLRKLRIPSIIGFILSGILVGPHGLNIIEKNAAVTLFSTIGLLYIMFLAGLELDLREFSKNKHKSILFGLLTFIIPLVLGYFTCHYLLGYNAEASFLTASMFATHTLVAYPIVLRLGISRIEPVAISVGATIITDTIVLVLLAIISGSHQSGLQSIFWTRFIVSLILFFFITFWILPHVASWFFKVLESEKNSHFIFVLTIVFFCAFLAEVAGLEPIIGAFVAGILLNRLIPHTSALMNRIEFVGTSLFIPIFLISVGMIVNIAVVFTTQTAMIVAVVLTIMALFSKYLAAWITGLFLKYNNREVNLMFGLSSSHAAATLAIIMVGFSLGIIDENILNGTIILILITCLAASFFTERAAKKLAETSKSVNDQLLALTQQKIMVPISNPITMEVLIDFAVMLQKPENKFPILGVSIVKDGENAQRKLLESRLLLNNLIKHAASVDQKIDIVATIDQNVPMGISRSSKEYFITEIVLGWPNRPNLVEYIFGKTTRKIISQTSQTIFLCNFPTPLTHYKKMVILAPPLVEAESGFALWVERMTRVAKILSLKLHLRSTVPTYDQMRFIVSKLNISKTVHFTETVDINYEEEFSSLSSDEFPVIIIPRKGTLSHNPSHESVQEKLYLLGETRSFIALYPQIYSEGGILGISEDFDPGIVNHSFSTLSKRYRLLRRWFHGVFYHSRLNKKNKAE